jgi:hypothetical protein
MEFSSEQSTGLPDFSWFNLPKRENCTKLPSNKLKCQKTVQMAVNYSSIFHFKNQQDLPKLGFLCRNYTIRQPWQWYWKSYVLFWNCSFWHTLHAKVQMAKVS